MDCYELQKPLKDAIAEFYEKERELLKHKGIEQAMVFRIGIYLNELLKKTSLKDHSLDCEYNKKGKDPKTEIDDGTAIRPDMLIHKRGSGRDNNILAIEFKGWWNTNRSKDIEKLKNLTKPNGGYKYKLGVFVVLEERSAEYSFFKGGKKIGMERVCYRNGT
ncbi:MAG: hypothetical protein COA81_09965 [Alphaproteobacteria bacterium]|nr:MAG: hypothetical protein COA81_09965 [Alphaproteobacteria bacterium]